MATIDLSDLPEAAGGSIIGGERNGILGRTLAAAGDVNGDGIGDVIVGGEYKDANGRAAADAYVIFGKAGGIGTIDLASLDPADGFRIQARSTGDFVNLSVASAGDMNGDGYDDLVLGTPFGNSGGRRSGETFVLFGKPGEREDIYLPRISGADGFFIEGGAPGDQAGTSVASAGDVNRDGFDDLIIGAIGAGEEGAGAGEAYVIFGKARGFGRISLSDLQPDQGFVIEGEDEDDLAGWSVASADVNGDGYSDLLVGAIQAYEVYGRRGGRAYVVLGKAEGFGDVDLANLSRSDGFLIHGADHRDYLGWSISSAGDLNGDGFDEIIVGAPFGDDGGYRAGEAYVIFGREDGYRRVHVDNLHPNAGFVILGDDDEDFAGRSVSQAGDVNGDGFDDIIIGAPFGEPQTGRAYVIFGKRNGFGEIDLGNLSDAEGFTIDGARDYDNTGFAVSGGGDVNGDGFADVIVGVPNYDSYRQTGAAYVVYGLAPTTAVTRVGSRVGQAILGGAFDDTLQGLAGNDRLEGRDGSDRLLGGDGDDALAGGDGRDILNGGDGADLSSGGAGDDLYVIQQRNDRVAEDPDGGSDMIKAYVDHAIPANVENLRLFGPARAGTGNELANHMIGSDGHDTLRGMDGEDVLIGLGGADTLSGGVGADLLSAGAGEDVLIGGAARDVLKGGTGADDLDGGSLGDRLFGEGGADVLNGGEGDDRLLGGTQLDTMVGGVGADQFIFADGDTGASRSSADRILDFEAASDRINLRSIDAIEDTPGDDRFSFIGDQAFSGTAGELRYDVSGGNTYVQGDTDGDGTADFLVRLDGLHMLQASDLIL